MATSPSKARRFLWSLGLTSAVSMLIVNGGVAYAASDDASAHSASTSVGTNAQPLEPGPADPPNAGTGEEVRIGETLEDSVLLGISGEEPQISAQSIPLNPQDVLECDFLGNADHVVLEIETYPYSDGANYVWPGGDVDLRCGTDATSGYKHIRQRHQHPTPTLPNAWETVRQSASDALGYTSPQVWDEYMVHAVHDSLDYSYPYPTDIGNQKVCFSAPFHIFKGAQIYASYYVNTILSKSNFLVVTAYPSTNSQVSDCSQE